MFFLVFFVVGFLLSAIFAPKAKVENARASSLSDFNFPRAGEGDPVPRIYGTVKFKAPNTIWAGDFEARPIKKKQKTGLFSSKKVTTGYKYYVGLDLAICLGPGFVYRRVWAGKHELFNGCFFGEGCNNVVTVNRPEMFGGETKNGGFVGDVALYCGDFGQPQDSYLAAVVDPKVPRYTGIAHMVFRKCYFGNSPNIEPIYIEGSYFTNSLQLNEYAIMPNGFDANPVEVLYDIYVVDWGNLDINPALINVEQWRAIGQVVHGEGNGISLEIANANTGGDVTKEILRQIGATLFQNPSNGLFELVLIRADYDVEDLPVFGPSEIKAVSNFTKALWEETTNAVRVKFTDRAQGYKENTIAQARDFANIRFQGRIKPSELSFPGVYDADLANTIAARELSQANVPLYQAELTMNREAVALAPGKPFVLNWPEYGIIQMVMRVRKFGLGTLKDGTISVSVVQDEFALDTVVMAPPVGTPYTPPDNSPHEVAPIFFELPYWLRVASGFTLDADKGFLAILAKAPGNYSIGYNVVTDYAGEEPAEIMTQEPYSATAQLVDALPRFAGFNDEGVQDIVTIKNVSDPDVLTTVLAGVMRQGHGLFYLNGELLSYREVVDNEDGTFELSDVHRALMDTGWVGGEADDVLYLFDAQNGFIEDAFGPAPLKAGFVGKLQDVTTAGSLPLEDLDDNTVAPAGRANLPLAPDQVRLDDFHNTTEQRDVGDTATLTWLERNRLTDPADLKWEDDETEAPEADTTYKVTVETELGDIIEVADAIATPTYDIEFTNDMAGHSVVLVWAVRGADVSFAASPFPVRVNPTDDTLTVDGYLVHVDGEKVTVA